VVDRPDEHGPALALDQKLCSEVRADHVLTLAVTVRGRCEEDPEGNKVALWEPLAGQ
jgi:hypothetical protein